MVEKLRKKFIRISMLSFSIVFILSILSVNSINIYRNIRDSRLFLNFSINEETGFTFLEKKGQKNDSNESVRAEESGENLGISSDYLYDKKVIEGKLRDNKRSDRPFSSREEQKNIVVFTDSNKNIIAYRDRFMMMKENKNEIESVIKYIYDNGYNEGFYENYIFNVKEEGGYKKIAISDLSMQIRQIKSFAMISLVIISICEIFVYILLRLFSNRAIKPILDNIEEQKSFIDNASHEIKTPLSIISANNDIVEMTQGESEWTRSTSKQVKRLNSLVEEMLMLSKYSEKDIEQNLSLGEVGLSDLIESSIFEFKPIIKSREIDFALNLGDFTVITRYEDIKSIVSILMENAVKYVSEKNIIRIELEKRKLNEEEILSLEKEGFRFGRGEELICLDVLNSCVDIKKGDLDHLFDRFYRVDKSRSRDSGGNGLGLSIAKAAANKNNLGLIASMKDESMIKFSLVFI